MAHWMTDSKSGFVTDRHRWLAYSSYHFWFQEKIILKSIK